MKIILILILLLPITIFSQSQIGWMGINTNTIKADKQIHFTGFGAVSTMGYMVTYATTDGNRKKAKIVGIGIASALATGKELTDKTGFDWVDLGYSVAGAVTLVYSYDFITRRAERRNAKRDKIIAMTEKFYKNNNPLNIISN